MIESFASYLSNKLILMGTTKEEERPFLTYGLFCLMSGSVQIGLLLIISLLFNTVIQTAIFAFCFGLLKRTIGGWHARHHHTCLALFTSLAAVCVCLGMHLEQSLVMPLTLIFTALMWLIVWLKAPVEHPNNPQTAKRLGELKRISRGIAAGEAFGLIIPAALLHNTDISRIALTGAMGGLCAAIALLPRLPVNPEKGGERHE